jgi:hypothetical protein
MTDIGDSQFTRGEEVWVVDDGGQLQPAVYVGEAEANSWFGGPPTVIVILDESRRVATVEVDRVISKAD